MRILLFILLFPGTCLLHGNGQIDDLKDKISNIFRGIEFEASSITQDKNEISKIISNIDKNAIEAWCSQKEAKDLHPVVEIIFSPFYSGVSSPKSYVAYTKRAIQLATEIIDIINQNNPQIFETTDYIMKDINYKINQSNTFDVFNKIILLKEKEQLLKEVYSGLEQLVQKMPEHVWHYRVSEKSNNPFEICVNNLQTQVYYIYLIKAIIQTTSQKTFNDERYFNYTSDILGNTKIGDRALGEYPNYLNVTAETVDAILQQQPNLINDSHIEQWPIYGMIKELEELEDDPQYPV